MSTLLLLGADIMLQILNSCVREKMKNITIITIKTFREAQSVHLLLFCKVGYQTRLLSAGTLETKEGNLKNTQTTKQAMRLVHRHICASSYLHMEMSTL